MIFTFKAKQNDSLALAMALQIAGEKIRNDDLGVRISHYPSRDEFKLEDSWFGHEPQTSDTVALALEKFCGITVRFEQGDEGLKMTSMQITNQKAYADTVEASRRALEEPKAPKAHKLTSLIWRGKAPRAARRSRATKAAQLVPVPQVNKQGQTYYTGDYVQVSNGSGYSSTFFCYTGEPWEQAYARHTESSVQQPGFTLRKKRVT